MAPRVEPISEEQAMTDDAPDQQIIADEVSEEEATETA